MSAPSPAPRKKLALARRMRRAPSQTERLLWKLLRDRRLEEMKFRRQVPIGPYVADFACLRHRLVVEADGPHHDVAEDAARDAWLRAERFRVLRLPNADVLNRPERVLAAIIEAVLGIPSPLAGEGGRRSLTDEGSRRPRNVLRS